MKFYTLNTYDYNNITRMWYLKSEFENLNLQHHLTLGLQAMQNGVWYTLDEIINNNITYYSSFTDDHYEHLDSAMKDPEVIERELMELVSLGAVIETERVGLTTNNQNFFVKDKMNEMRMNLAVFQRDYVIKSLRNILGTLGLIDPSQPLHVHALCSKANDYKVE